MSVCEGGHDCKCGSARQHYLGVAVANDRRVAERRMTVREWKPDRRDS